MSNPVRPIGFEPNMGFVEAHFYDGGLRNQVVAESSARPTWAPDFEWVGFQDEVKLSADDLIVEVVKFANQDMSVSWIGVFAHSPDAKFGDRNNYAGVGVWLRNCFPHEPELLVDGLAKLLEKLKSFEMDAFSGAARRFLKDFLGGIVSPYTQLQAPIGGLPPAKGHAFETTCYAIRNGKNREAHINNLLLRAFFLSEDFADQSRMLIHVSDQESAPGFVRYKVSDFGSSLARIVPIAFAEQSNEIQRLSEEVSASDKLRYELDQQVDMLRSEAASLRDQVQSSKLELEQFKRSVEEDDELKRFGILNGGISDLQRSLLELQRALPDLRNSINDDLMNQVRKINAYPPQQVKPDSSREERNSFRGEFVQHHPERRKSVDLYRVLLILSVLLVPALLFYLIYVLYLKFG